MPDKKVRLCLPCSRLVSACVPLCETSAASDGKNCVVQESVLLLNGAAVFGRLCLPYIIL